MAFNVKERKRELICENIKRVKIAAEGEKLAKIFVILMLFARSALLIFEIIYSSLSAAEISIWSHLLFLPFLIVIYMVYDGNKPLVYIPMISAPLRLVYHFTAVLPTITAEGVNLLTAVSLVLLAAQFFFAVFMSANTKCDVYFTAMQKVNLKLRSEIIGGRK